MRHLCPLSRRRRPYVVQRGLRRVFNRRAMPIALPASTHELAASETPVLRVSPAVFAQIRHHLGRWPAERGGALGVDEQGVVRAFHFDATACTSDVIYTPDTVGVERVRKGRWRREGIRLIGFVHSHPAGLIHPSLGDRAYAARIIDALDELDHLWLPIVQTEPDTGSYSILPVLAVPTDDGGVDLQRGRLEVERVDLEETFDRVADAYDLRRLGASRIVAIGCGGAAAFLEQMARAGVGEFVLVDPDVVEEPNLATQQAYRRDLGRPKVEALADRLLDINPNVVVLPVHGTLDDLRSRVTGELLAPEGEGGTTVLCGFTDHFPTQARVNRLGLHHGVPTLSAQVWQQGMGAEVTFTSPGVTPACQRCALASRYRVILEGGRIPDVGSAGTPIFATDRLNALKGFIALALLHHGAERDDLNAAGQRWSDLLERIGDRNLALIRMDPDLGDKLGVPGVDRALQGADGERLLFDETVWLPQAADGPESPHGRCGDCGGIGDLRLLEGRVPRTRLPGWPPRRSEPGDRADGNATPQEVA